jgi:hypothetical protein
LNDDGTELEREEGKVRGRIGRRVEMSYRLINKEVWNEVNNLPFNYEAPRWDSLILDALKQLPEKGPAIIIAFTALEVFISSVLTNLHLKSQLPKKLWEMDK